jgi:tRNA(adenine34) deaminase
VDGEHEHFMAEALKVARLGLEHGEMPIGAIVVVDDEIIASQYTQERSAQRLLVHADLLAMEEADRQIGKDRSRGTLYVTLEPCLMCLGAAFTSKLGRVVYGLESPSDGGAAAFVEWEKTRDESAMPGYSLPDLVGGVGRTESAELFARYAAGHSEDSWASAWARDLSRLVER